MTEIQQGANSVMAPAMIAASTEPPKKMLLLIPFHHFHGAAGYIPTPPVNFIIPWLICIFRGVIFLSLFAVMASLDYYSCGSHGRIPASTPIPWLFGSALFL